MAQRSTRPFDVASLAAAIGIPATDTAGLSRAVGISRRWIRRYRVMGLTVRQADTWATRVGLHPTIVWPAWEEPDPDLDDILDTKEYT